MQAIDKYINQIIQGDCLGIMREMPDKCVDAIITDPPYNIGKDTWDKIVDYYDWLQCIFVECQRILKENGTLWFFHISFSSLSEIHQRLINNTSFVHKQLVIINKGLGSIAGRCNIEVLRSFPRATEYLQFYTFEDITGAEQLSEVYASKNPMAKYLKDEFKRANVSRKEIATLFPSKTGGMTGCVSNWLIGYNFPLKEQYLKMREYLNNEYLRKEYEYLRKEYEDLRYKFELPLSLTDVWDINFYNEPVNEHSTTKPINIYSRIIKTVTNENNIILDCFSGLAPLAIACHRMNRRFICIEKEPKYVELSRRRLKEEMAQMRLEL